MFGSSNALCALNWVASGSLSNSLNTSASHGHMCGTQYHRCAGLKARLKPHSERRLKSPSPPTTSLSNKSARSTVLASHTASGALSTITIGRQTLISMCRRSSRRSASSGGSRSRVKSATVRAP